MPLSEQEERALAQIAEGLSRESFALDPHEPALRRSRWLRRSFELCILLGATGFLVSLFLPVGPSQIGVLAVVAFLLSSAVGLYFAGARTSLPWLRRRASRSSTRPVAAPPASRSGTPLLRRLEERWERRQEERYDPR